MMMKSSDFLIQAGSLNNPSVANINWPIPPDSVQSLKFPAPDLSAVTCVTRCTTTDNVLGVNKPLPTLLIAKSDDIYIMSSFSIRISFTITVNVCFTVYMNLLFPSVHLFPNEGILFILKAPIYRKEPFLSLTRASSQAALSLTVFVTFSNKPSLAPSIYPSNRVSSDWVDYTAPRVQSVPSRT